LSFTDAKSVDDCIYQYINLSEKVFKRDQVMTGVIPTGDNRCRFDVEILQKVIQDLVKAELNDVDATMAEVGNDSGRNNTCPTFVVATSANNADGPAIIFRSYDYVGYSANKCKIWQAAHCTSAAPSFFKPMFIEIPAPGGWYLDDGLRHNNPSQLAQDEDRRMWPTVKRFCVVSIGTGQQRNVEFIDIKDSDIPTVGSSKPSKVRSALSRLPGVKTLKSTKNAPGGVMELGKIGKATVEMSTSAEPIHQALLKLAKSTDPDLQFPYHRFNIDRGMETIGLEEWKTRVRMAEFTRRYLMEEEGETKRNACVQDLLKPPPVERT
jgi:predicted acylesterase/phospholipase RssA